MVEMMAKTLGVTDMPPEALLSVLRKEGLRMSNPNKVKVVKDFSTKKRTMYGHIQALFDLQGLSDDQRFYLRHILLIPDEGIPKRLFGEWLGTNDFNLVNTLIEFGWLKEDEVTRRISMHPFLCEVIASFDCPSFDKCGDFLERLRQEYADNDADKVYYRDLLNLAPGIFRFLEVNDTTQAFQMLKQIIGYLDNHMYFQTMSEVLTVMKDAVPLGADHPIETATYEFHWGVVLYAKMDGENAESRFKNSISCLKPFDEVTGPFASALYSRLAGYYMMCGNGEKYQECAECAASLKEKYGLTGTIDYEFDKVNSWLGSLMTNATNESFDLDVLVEAPELEGFRTKARESGIPTIGRDELQVVFEQVEPEELFDDSFKSIVAGVKNTLVDNVGEQPDEISLIDMLGMVFDATEENTKGQR